MIELVSPPAERLMYGIDRKYVTFSADATTPDETLRAIETRSSSRFAQEGYKLLSETIVRGDVMATVHRVFGPRGSDD